MTKHTQLGRRLIQAIEQLGRGLRVARQQVAAAHNLSVLQLQLVEHIAEHSPQRVGELAEELNVTQPTVSDALDSLEGKGIVTRLRDPDDGRASIISLTRDGEEVSAEILEDLNPILTSSSTNTLEEQAIALHVVLNKIKHFKEEGAISINRSCFSCGYYRAPSPPYAARCIFLDEPLEPQDVRVDCPDHRESGTQ